MQNTTLDKVVVFGKYISVAFLIVLSQISAVFANQDLATLISNNASCGIGLADTWIITRQCNLGGGTNIKVDDAINIQCDVNTQLWTVEFYEEVQDASNNQSIRYEVCPGNGYLDVNDSGQMVMRCNYWESDNNLRKQLVFAMDEPVIQSNYGEKSMTWTVIDRDNPNMACGIAARPESGTGSGSGTTVNNDGD